MRSTLRDGPTGLVRRLPRQQQLRINQARYLNTNLTATWTADELRSAFRRLGELHHLRILADRRRGRTLATSGPLAGAGGQRSRYQKIELTANRCLRTALCPASRVLHSWLFYG